MGRASRAFSDRVESENSELPGGSIPDAGWEEACRKRFGGCGRYPGWEGRAEPDVLSRIIRIATDASHLSGAARSDDLPSAARA